MAANHTSFKPGQSGNPGGKPKGTRSLLRAIRAKLVERLKDAEEGEEDGYDRAAGAFVAALLNGSFQHAKELIEREEGKVPDRTELQATVRLVKNDLL